MATFDWDPTKARSNLRKHKVSFEEARSVFYDDYARIIDDGEARGGEARFVILGFSDQANVLIVCHCYRGVDEVIRLISARKANAAERRQYEEYRK